MEGGPGSGSESAGAEAGAYHEPTWSSSPFKLVVYRVQRPEGLGALFAFCCLSKCRHAVTRRRE